MRELLFITTIVISVILPSVAAGVMDEGLVAWWKFDEGRALESISGIEDSISGNYKIIESGVSSRCLRFDGFSTLVSRKAEKAPSLSGGVTFEAWVAVAAYPWNLSPIVSQREGEKRGYYFGIDSEGHFGLQLSVGGKWVKCRSETALDFKKWYHVAAVYDPVIGITLYLDGNADGQLAVKGEIDFADDIDIHIGRNHEKMVPAHRVREWAKFPSWYSFDGFYDEVKLYNSALSADDVLAAWRAKKPSTAPDMPQRRFPRVSGGTNRFGAYHTRLKYYEQWDALWQMAGEPDIVVKFDEHPVQVVFWRGTRYSPCWVTENGKWMADQSLETGVWPDKYKENGSKGALGCCEHMSDTRCKFSHVRIVENNDARVVVHWRYAMVDAGGLYFAYYDEVKGQGQWGDEYYYIYPDAVTTRDVTAWWPNEYHGLHQETIFLSEPGTKPEDNCQLEAITLANLAGESRTYSWEKGVPHFDIAKPVIQMVNFKSQYKPLMIFKPKSKVSVFGGEVRREYSHFPWWNHWPVAQVASDGRYCMAADRAAHSSLTQVGLPPGAILYGLTDKPAEVLVPLAKSWISPPKLKVKGTGTVSKGYDQDQRAYVLNCKQPVKELELEFLAGEEEPIVNPAFVINNWGQADAVLKIDGKTVNRGKNFRFGHRHTLESIDLIVWIKKESTRPCKINLISEEDARKTPNPAGEIIPALPPIKPLFDFPVRDTSICVGPDGTYYLTGTTGHPTWWKTNDGVRMWKSKDLKRWDFLGLVWSIEEHGTWQKKSVDGRRAVWAPEIHYINGTFWIPYCMNYAGTGLLRSTTGKAEGPYIDIKKDGPLTGEIDASLFQDDDGKVYFVYQNGKIARMKDDMSGLAEKPRLLKPSNHKHVGFEGAFITKMGAKYLLVCAEFNKSGNSGTYDCMISSSDKLLGPYGERYLAIPHGGHNMLFKDGEGNWYSTFFGAAKRHDKTAPFNERPAILRIGTDENGRVRPLLSK